MHCHRSTEPAIRLINAIALLLPLSLAAATAQDIHGIWEVDAEATWAVMREHPALKPRLAAIAPEPLAMLTAVVLGKMARTRWSIGESSAEITDPDGTVRTSTWVIIRDDDGTLTITAIDERGATTSGTLTLADDHLIARGFGRAGRVGPEATILLKRQPPTATVR